LKNDNIDEPQWDYVFMNPKLYGKVFVGIPPFISNHNCLEVEVNLRKPIFNFNLLNHLSTTAITTANTYANTSANTSATTTATTTATTSE